MIYSQGLTEAKKQNHELIERVQAMQNELSDSEVRRAELETQIRQSHTLLVQRQEQEQELNKKLQKVRTHSVTSPLPLLLSTFTSASS